VKRILFTDLDGTLLDRFTYSYEKSLEAITFLRAKGIPIIFCSAKTAAEQEEYRRELGIEDPFIVENGGAIFIPQDYFASPIPQVNVVQGYLVIQLGLAYETVREMLKGIEWELEIPITGFGDMSAEEISERTRLSPKFAELAKQREYDEPFYLNASPCQVSQVLDKLEQAGLRCTPVGSHYSTIGNTDKGKAIAILSDLFKQEFGEIETIGIGDSQNDLPMLEVVDVPVLVQKGSGEWAEVDSPKAYRVEGVGPDGWSKAVRQLFGEGKSARRHDT
jgi:mannosyl-3-phosphoglycerate phosphatase